MQVPGNRHSQSRYFKLLYHTSITISYTVSCSAEIIPTLSSTTTEPQSGTINMLLKTHLVIHTSTVSIGESESKPSTTNVVPASNMIVSSTVTKLITKTMGELA